MAGKKILELQDFKARLSELKTLISSCTAFGHPQIITEHIESIAVAFTTLPSMDQKLTYSEKFAQPLYQMLHSGLPGLDAAIIQSLLSILRRGLITFSLGWFAKEYLNPETDADRFGKHESFYKSHMASWIEQDRVGVADFFAQYAAI
jgi:hypothetical protein